MLKFGLCVLAALSIANISMLEAASAKSWQVEETWRLEDGLARPESVVFDNATNALYVSNINGGGDEKNGKGYIAKVSLDGKLLQANWAEGLNAPKGIAIVGGKLIVADIDEVVQIDIKTAVIEKKYPAEGAVFLNDVAAAQNGAAYISDSKSSRIYRLSKGALSMWLDDGRVRRPNGLQALSAHLVVAAGDSQQKKPHKARYLQVVGYDGKSVRPWRDAKELGRIDGLQSDAAGGFFVTDFRKGTLMHVSPEEGVTKLASPGKGAADLIYETATGSIYLPVMGANALVAFAVKRSD